MPRWPARDPDTMTKVCAKCKIAMPKDNFYNNRQRWDGKYPNCIECHQRYMRTRYATNPQVRQYLSEKNKLNRANPDFVAATKRRSAKFYESIEGRARVLLTNARKSPDGNSKCTVTLDHIIQGIQRGYCPVTKIRFDLTRAHQAASGRKKNPYAPSLDRIDSRGGYTNENTRVVIWQYNMMKGELTDTEVRFICECVLGKVAVAA